MADKPDVLTLAQVKKNYKITNVGSLPGGRGCQFLEVMHSHIPDTIIAVQWRRKIPASLPVDHFIVDLGERR